MSELHYKILISDVDGVMNDGKLLIGPDGEEPYKNFNVKRWDGYKIIAESGGGLCCDKRARELTITRSYGSTRGT